MIATVEDTREMLLGSFDILMSRTGQRTNDVMKILTIASVVILDRRSSPGILGMNFHPPFFDSPNLFWAALGVMAMLICGTLIAARRMRWISFGVPRIHCCGESSGSRLNVRRRGKGLCAWVLRADVRPDD